MQTINTITPITKRARIDGIISYQLSMQSVHIASCEFKSRSWRSVIFTTLCGKVFSDISHAQFTMHLSVNFEAYVKVYSRHILYLCYPYTQFTTRLSHNQYTPHHYHRPLTFTLHTIPIHYLRVGDRMVILKLDLKLSKQSASITTIFNSILFMERCTWYKIIWKTL